MFNFSVRGGGGSQNIGYAFYLFLYPLQKLLHDFGKQETLNISILENDVNGGRSVVCKETNMILEHEVKDLYNYLVCASLASVEVSLVHLSPNLFADKNH